MTAPPAGEVSALERERRLYRPHLPALLEGGLARLSVESSGSTSATADAETIRRRFPRTFGRGVARFDRGSGPQHGGPLRVGVVLSGGQAPGGHNVIVGLRDALVGLAAESRVVGFLGGPRGIFRDEARELADDEFDRYRNTGGFDWIGSGRDKIETTEQLEACRRTAERRKLDGLVVIGGDDSNTNAAVLAEFFAERGAATAVVGVPKTIDGDLKGGPVEISFGFDTATRVYSELIGNIARDARSAGKYWHFVKLMGRAASHVTLECALQTRPNFALIGEEVRARGRTLQEIVDGLAEVVALRAADGRHHGVCLVPEGLIEFVPEMRALIAELNDLLAAKSASIETIADTAGKRAYVAQRLKPASAEVFAYLPERIQAQLLLDRDSHGNVQVSKIDTEQLLATQVARRLSGERVKFSVQTHFFGYEGRCAAPTNFDADYTYALGWVAAALVAFRCTGMLACVRNLVSTGAREALGVPLTSLMGVEMRHGEPKPVIAKSLVDLDGAPFRAFAEARDDWASADRYLYPGPIQYFGPEAVSSAVSRTLALEAAGSAADA